MARSTAVKGDEKIIRELLEHILKEEDEHVDWLEEQRDQISQMGLAVYLSTQTK
jgi:bacterioferritin